MQIKFKEIDQNWNDGQTNVWFYVDGESFAVAVSCDEYALLDADGIEIINCNDHNKLLNQLKPLAIEIMESQV